MHAGRLVNCVGISSETITSGKQIQAQYKVVAMGMCVITEPSQVLRTIRYLLITALYLNIGLESMS